MAYTRLYTGASHADIYLKFRPSYPPELFNKIISFLCEKRPPPHQLLIDVGCGSGQGTYGLSSQFERVIGFDVSKEQVEAATKGNSATNVEFKVSPAESLPFLADRSVDLVSCAQSAHWFDIKAFCDECKRVLKPNGCLAMFGYCFAWLDHKDADVKKQLEEDNKNYYGALADNWSDKITIVENRYADITLPFPDIHRSDRMEMRFRWSVSHFMGYLRSGSTYQKYLESNRSGRVAEEYQDSIMAAVATPDASPEDTMVDVIFPLFLLMGRAS